VAPIDGDFGGTWIAANEFGISLCLLNGANVSQTQTGNGPYAGSRGLLLLQLIDASSAAAAVARLSIADLSTFAPFTLALLERGRPAVLFEWNGIERLTVPCGDPYLPLTSSSFNADLAGKARHQEYLRLRGSHVEFHKSHAGGPGPYSTCMHRPDAETVSFSWVIVGESDAHFFYSPDAPCKGSPGTNMSLILRP